MNAGSSFCGQFDDAPEDHHNHQHENQVCDFMMRRSVDVIVANALSEHLRQVAAAQKVIPDSHLFDMANKAKSNSLSPTTAATTTMNEVEVNVSTISSSTSTITKEKAITDVNENDVLCGRGKGPNNHVGNRRFRELVKLHRRDYLLSRSREEKSRICRTIVKAIRNAEPQGRFLKRVGVDGWSCIDERKAIVKTSQALREGMTRGMLEKITQEAAPTISTSTTGSSSSSSIGSMSSSASLIQEIRLPQRQDSDASSHSDSTEHGYSSEDTDSTMSLPLANVSVMNDGSSFLVRRTPPPTQFCRTASSDSRQRRIPLKRRLIQRMEGISL